MKPAITLIELLIVIALVGIVAGVGWPNLDGWLCRQNHLDDFSNFTLYLKKMQSESMNRNRTTVVEVVDNGSPNSDFLRPYVLPANVNACTLAGAGPQTIEDLIPVLRFPPEMDISGNRIQCFFSDGSASNNTYEFARQCGNRNYQYRSVTFGATGLIQKLRFNNATQVWEEL